MEKSIIAQFEEQVKKFPFSIAVIEGDLSITYRDLNKSANQLAHYLISRGIQSETIISICGDRSIAIIIGILATLKAGAAYCPLDPLNPAERTKYMLQDSGSPIILTQKKYLEKLPPTDAILICLDDLPPSVALNSIVNPNIVIEPHNLAYVMYTSGTSGAPKGVMIEQRSIVNLASNQEHIALLPDYSIMHFSNISFDVSTFEMWSALLNGCQLIVVEQEIAIDFHAFKKIISQNPNPCVILTTRIFELAIDAMPDLFKGCRFVIFGGEVCNARKIKEYIVNNNKENLPDKLINAYGPTEATTFSTIYEIKLNEKHDIIPIGKPIKNVSIEILDPHMKACPIGQIGEIYIGGVGVARGYLNRSSLTQEKYLDVKGNKLYRTGDLGKLLQDGNIEFEGRQDNQVKIRGYRIELEEIEAALWAISDVESAAVKVQSNSDGDNSLTAFITIHKHLIRIIYQGSCEIKWQDGTSQLAEVADISLGGICLRNINRVCKLSELVTVKMSSLDPELVMMGSIAWQSDTLVGVHFLEAYKVIEEYINTYYQRKYSVIPQHRNLRALLEKKLPVYMLPDKILVLSTLPLTENGKVDRQALDKIDLKYEETPVEKTSESEEILMQLWREVLSISKIKSTDDFFELGGDLLLATKVLTKLKDQYNINITYDQFFSNPSLSKLSSFLGGQIEASHFNPIPIISRHQKLDLSISQKRMWFLSHFFPNIPLFNVTKCVVFDDKLIAGYIKEAIDTLIKRQEILKMCFSVSEEGEPFQRLSNLEASQVVVESDLLDVDEALNNSNSEVFDLTLPPLFRIRILFTSDNKTIFIVTFHRIICDEYSIEIFLQELIEIYKSIIENREVTLPSLTIQYADYSAWQINQLSSSNPNNGKLVNFWKNYLLGAPFQLELPYDKERPKEQDFILQIFDFTLDDKMLVPLNEISKKMGCTLNMTLFTSYIVLLFVLTGKRDLVLGMPLTNRSQLESENLIGPYENILPLRISFSPTTILHELLEEVKVSILNCYQHQDLRFEKMLEFLDVPVNLNQHPIFQMVFSYQRVSDSRRKEIQLNHEYSLFDLLVRLEEEKTHINASIHFSKQLFNIETIQSWVTLWKNILSLLPADLNATLQDLSGKSLSMFDKGQQNVIETKKVLIDEQHSPQTKVEKIIFKIWSELLKRNDISIADSFFEMGGHSLLLIQVISRIKAATDCVIPVKVFFEEPTIQALAKFIEHEPDVKGEEIKHLPYPVEIPLSYEQERLWFIEKLIPSYSVYNIPFVFRINGKLSIQKLKDAIDHIVNKHEILRTEFKMNAEGKPFQKIVQKVSVPFDIITNMDAPSDKVIENIITQPFNMERAPLFRVSVFKYNAEDFHIIISFHHIIIDGLSMKLFFNELIEQYENHSENEVVAKLPIQYADYAIFERNQLADNSALLENGILFWSNYLKNAPTLHECPLDFEREVVHRFEGKRVYFALTPDISKKINGLSTQVAGSDFVVLLSLFYVFLNKISLQNDILVATPVSGRQYSEVEDLIGFFVNMLPLRANVNQSATLVDFILNIKESVLKAFEYQTIPFEKILSTVNVKRALNYEPLTQVMFVLQNNMEPEFELTHLKIERDPYESPVSKYDISLVLEERDGIYKGFFEYDAQIFSEETIKTWRDRWLKLVQGAIANPLSPLFQLSLLSVEEENKVLIEWNDTARKFNQDITFNELLESQVLKSPNDIAIEFVNQSLTYSQLAIEVNDLSYYLLKEVKKPKSIVGIICDRSSELIITILAVMKSGNAFVIFDPELPLERLRYMMSDAHVDVIVTKKMYQYLIPDDFGSVIALETFYENTDRKHIAATLLSKVSPKLAYIIYTSGSTGKPKGVMIESQGLINRLQWWKDNIPFDQDEVFLNLFSFSFDGALGSLFWPLICGAQILIPPQEILLNPDALAEMIIKKNVTSLVGTPSLMNLILNEPKLRHSRLKKIIFAGEDLSKSVLEKARRITSASIYNFYGPTECTIISTCGKILPSQEKITIGRPVSNVKIYILDHYLKPVPIGMIGEIYIGGVGVSPGYISQPKLSETSFIANPFVLGERLYRSGDRGVWRENGEIEFRGRVDNLVKVHGYRVELEEIEVNLMEISEIKKAAVIFEKNKIVAFVVSNLSASEIKNALHRFLPDYYIPDKIVHVSEIPLLANGKLDRKLVLSDATLHEMVLPRTSTEKQLFAIFQDVLNIDNFSVTDSFFDLGGHSLLMTQTAVKIRKLTGYNLTLQEFYIYSTVELLAKHIDNVLMPELSYSHPILELLEQDIHLGDSIAVPSTPSLGDTVFITGATGFLGKYLLNEIIENSQATIYYLVQDSQNSKLKSDKLLKQYKGKRLFPIVGDLSKPNLGIQANIYELLSDSVSHIYHCAADVNVIRSYQQVRQTNVLGSVEILRLAASRKLKRITFISSMSSCTDVNELGQTIEDFPKTYPTGSEGGYVISKWVAEKIYEAAISRGFDITIFRSSALLESEQGGEVDFENNNLFLFVKGALQTGFAPIHFNKIDGLPVDFVAKLITMIDLNESPPYRVYNLNHPKPISTDVVFNWLNELGSNVQLIPFVKWKDEVLPHLPKDNAIYPLLSLYLSFHHHVNEIKEGESCAANNHTAEFVNAMSLVYPNLDINHFAFLIQNLMDSAKKH